jgi:hypothetical protein
MATRKEQEEAKNRMEAAEAALREYIERSPDIDADPVLHRRLAEELRKAEDEFLDTMK